VTANQRFFGVKDVFTTINVLGGVVAICLCIDGKPWWAGLAIMMGYAFGDALDGVVARLLNSANEFGAEYDTIADHNAHIIAPAAVVYTVYRNAGLVPDPWDQVLAIALAACIVVSASVRHARNIVRPVKFPGIWGGLPRSVLGFMTMAYVNSALASHVVGGMWFGVVLIPLLSIATLTYWPFASHHLQRNHWVGVRILIVLSFVSSFGILFLAPKFAFDAVFFWMSFYSLTAWLSLTRDERHEYRSAVQAALRGRTA
jgi:phosphatidylserine synthase